MTQILREALEVCEEDEARRKGLTATVRDTKYRSLGYMTEDGIAFEAYCTAVSSVRVLWNTTHGHFGVKQSTPPQFLNPKVTVKSLSRLIEVTLGSIMSELGDADVPRRLRRNNDRCKLFMVRSFKMDSTTQGLPVQSLVCSTAEEEIAGHRARRQSRFDWVTVSQGTRDIRFLTIHIRLLHLGILF